MTIEMPLVLSPSQSLELQFKISKYPLKFSLHNILCKIAVSRDTICFLSPVKKASAKKRQSIQEWYWEICGKQPLT